MTTPVDKDKETPTEPQASGEPQADNVTGRTNRRTVLKVALGAGATLIGTGTPVAGAEKPPEKMRPQPGDDIVFRFGDQTGTPIKPADVPGGAELLQAITKDPVSGVIRDGSRLNGINLARLDETDLDEATRPFAIEGVVAYSSVCTHQGCDLTQWLPDSRTFKCYCHYSEFDASKFGEPNHGPAKRNLAILPLVLTDAGTLQAGDKFQGKVGFPKK